MTGPDTSSSLAQQAPDAVECLAGFVLGDEGSRSLLPWAERLSDMDRVRLRGDLALLLSEPDTTGEPLDRAEIEDVLREYSALAGWDGPLLNGEAAPAEAVRFRVHLRPQEARALDRAPAAVRRVAGDLLARFLAVHPTDGSRLERGRLKKLSDRDVWQIDLPGGYRLRYLVAEPERAVHVVYLGPHPDGDADGLERAVRASVQRGRHERC